MAQIKNLRDFLAEVQRRGRLYEFTEPIHKESELMPLYRVQTRGLPEEGFSKMSAERTDANHPLISPEDKKRIVELLSRHQSLLPLKTGADADHRCSP